MNKETEMDEELEKIREKKKEKLKKEKKRQKFPEKPIEANINNFENIVDQYPLVLIDFRADWCSACQTLDPVIKQLAKKYSGKAVFAKVDVDRNPQLVKKFQVSGIPTLLIAKDGQVVDKMVGAGSKQKLIQKIENYLN